MPDPLMYGSTGSSIVMKTDVDDLPRCPRCGKTIFDEKKCPNCGEEVK